MNRRGSGCTFGKKDLRRRNPLNEHSGRPEILSGSDTAATDYFKSKTTNELFTAFRPFVEQTMNENGVTQQYEALSSKLNLVPFARSENLDINNYVGKALDGLFYMLAQEERKIRTNPAARPTDLLKEFRKIALLQLLTVEAGWGYLKIKRWGTWFCLQRFLLRRLGTVAGHFQITYAVQ